MDITATMAMCFAAMARGGVLAPSLALVRRPRMVQYCSSSAQRISIVAHGWSSARCDCLLRVHGLPLCADGDAGDVIGALLNRAEQTISYYKNGIELGTAFQHVMEERLYPCVGMQTQDEEVRPRVASSQAMLETIQ